MVRPPPPLPPPTSTPGRSMPLAPRQTRKRTDALCGLISTRKESIVGYIRPYTEQDVHIRRYTEKRMATLPPTQNRMATLDPTQIRMGTIKPRL